MRAKVKREATMRIHGGSIMFFDDTGLLMDLYCMSKRTSEYIKDMYGTEAEVMVTVTSVEAKWDADKELVVHVDESGIESGDNFGFC